MTGSSTPSNVFWSDRLEVLAEGLYWQWARCTQGDPFAQFCVVVGDLATRNWLQHYFLMHRPLGQRRILANIRFVPIAEFVNDWLAAQVHQTRGVRKAAEHPYAKGVLTWRIEAILRDHGGEACFAPLQSYLAGENPEVQARRRYDLAEQLAKLFDGYLASRPAMLRRWEQGRRAAGEPVWQVALYRQLVAEEPGTYARDYEAALAADCDPEQAFAAGFPRYAGVAVFDVSVAPWPYLKMLEQLSRVLPMIWWSFNPAQTYWLENPTKRQAVKAFTRRLTQALLAGETELPEAEAYFADGGSKLLGALASGGRGVLSAELEMSGFDSQWVSAGQTAEKDFATVANSAPEIHACTGPRRELEVAKEAMHRFFADHPEARACDALLLCADWPTYAPLVEAVFMGGAEGQIPVQLAQGTRSESAMLQAWEQLLAFRDNRFEVSAVFELLGCPEVRLRFGLAFDEVGTLREMVQQNNLHWGFDAADVARTLHQAPEEAPDEAQTPFTWRRGLDRFVVDALYGPREEAGEVVELSGLGAILPVGEVEGERAQSVGKLAAFVEALARLRQTLQGESTAEVWQEVLLKALERFYLADEGEALVEANAIRHAIVSTTREMLVARIVAKRPPERVPGEVICQAVLRAMKGAFRGTSAPGDAVRVAPLTPGAAVPAKFVWICGLNDGTFPRVDFKPSFDLVWRKPSLFEVSAREVDGYAFLKAVLGAREKLGLSYVGLDAQNQKDIPASVFLLDLKDWLEEAEVPYASFKHPLQAHSPRYFLPPGATKEPPLPTAFSALNREIAERLCADGAPVAVPEVALFTFVPGQERIIPLEDLAAFYAHPCQMIARKRLNLSPPRLGKAELNDEDALAVSPSKAIVSQNLLQHAALMGEPLIVPRLREEGCSLGEQEIRETLKQLSAEYGVMPLRYSDKACKPFSTALSLPEAARRWCAEGEACNVTQEVVAAGQPMTVAGQVKLVAFATTGVGELAHLFRFGQRWKVDEAEVRAAWVFHVAGHAAGQHFATVMMGLTRGPAQVFPPLAQDEAQAFLAAMVAQALKPCPFSLSLAIDYTEDVPPADLLAALQMPTPWKTVDKKL
ncbi:MAG: exodeoxyribonuclease V subunit gamma [Candidatus Spyradenecus sp.]